MLTPDVLRTFAMMDTSRQVATLRRVGLDTDCADAVLGHLAGNYPEQYNALGTALARRDGVPLGDWQNAA